MHSTVLVVTAVFLSAGLLLVPSEMKARDDQLDGYAMFNDLSKETAAKKAHKMAEADFARNVYRIFVVGKRPAKNACDDYLSEHFGVRVTPIAGCIISAGIMGAQDGYNSTMKRLLNRKFGRDIFKEAGQAL